MGHSITGSHRTQCHGTHTVCRRGCDGYQRFARALVLTLGLASFAMINHPVMAQTNSYGPVHYPPPGAVAPASTVTPSSAIAPAPDANIPVPPPAAQIPTAPITTQAPAPASDTGGDIHDIHGVISIPYEWLWLAYIVAGLAAVGLIFAAWRFLRRKVAAKAKQPYEIALEKLNEARALMKVETVREYAFTVSEIIRIYIEQRFAEKAARRTTEEFLSDLLAQTGTPLAQHRTLLEDFLNHCDLIKFARWGATERELESMHESARAFILDTQPQPESARPATVPQPQIAQVK